MEKKSGGPQPHDPSPVAPISLALPAAVVVYDNVEYEVIWRGVGPLPGYHVTQPTESRA